MNILEQAQTGFDSGLGMQSNPYLKTSPAWSGFYIGAWMKATGRTRPHDCRTSRGDTFHINGMKVRITCHRDGVDCIERIS